MIEDTICLAVVLMIETLYTTEFLQYLQIVFCGYCFRSSQE